MLEFSMERNTSSAPNGAQANCGDSGGVSEVTNVSTLQILPGPEPARRTLRRQPDGASAYDAADRGSKSLRGRRFPTVYSGRWIRQYPTRYRTLDCRATFTSGRAFWLLRIPRETSMKSTRFGAQRARIHGLVLAIGLTALGASSFGVAQSDDAPLVPMEISINALMVALVDHAAHEIWEAASATTLTGRDWQGVEQHATQLVAAGTLISLGGTGRSDRGWVASPAWQEYSRELTDAALTALAAVKGFDQRALHEAGERIVDTCFGCHDMFKPDAPTEGLMHVPHYED